MVCETQLYDLLSVPVTATSDQICKSYRKLALRYHPDKNNHNAESTEKFKDLSQAYEILKDPRKRQIYDAYGTKGLDGSYSGVSHQQVPRGFDPSRQSRNPAFGFEQAVFSSLFADMSSAFGPGGHFSQSFSQSSFGQSFQCGMNFVSPGHNINSPEMSRTIRPDFSSRKSTTPKKGTNIYHDFKVTLADMYHGKEARFSLPKLVKCSVCHGHGCYNPKKCNKCEGTGRLVIHITNQLAQFEERRECDSCNGTGTHFRAQDACTSCERGYKMKSHIIRVRIPPGSKNGDKCILTGQSDEGRDIDPGDVIIRLLEQPHPFLVRRGNDLFMEHDIDLKTALLGGRVILQDFPRTGEDIIIYVNVHGRRGFNETIHPLVNAGEIVGTIKSGVPKRVRGLGMPVNDSIKDGVCLQNENTTLNEDITSFKRGDLYIKFNVTLPEISEFASEDDLHVLQKILPGGGNSDSFGTVAWEHHLSNVPGLEPSSLISVDRKSPSSSERESSDYDYEQIDFDSQEGSEEQEDNQFYAKEWTKESEINKRRKVV